MFLLVSKPTCSSVVFSLRLRVFFRTESYNLIGTNWYLPTVLPSCLSLNFHPHYFVKYFYCRTLCLRGHPKRRRTFCSHSAWSTSSQLHRVGSRSMTVVEITNTNWYHSNRMRFDWDELVDIKLYLSYQNIQIRSYQVVVCKLYIRIGSYKIVCFVPKQFVHTNW